MRLFLSSYSLGAHPQRLSALVGGRRRAAIIASASPPDAGRVAREVTLLAELGLSAAELDLGGAHTAAEMRAALKPLGLVWVLGGNSFSLRYAMRRSGFDVAVRQLLEDDHLVYAGYSAGSVVATPTLRGIELVDDHSVLPSDDVVWDGMGLVDYCIAPHYRSQHPESAAIERVVAYWRHQDMPYRTLHDGEALLVEGGATQLLTTP